MVPILLITGFLGSGKTTFINYLLEKSPNAKISIILNEFGSIKLESQFVTQKADNIVELANGCMCCVAKSDIPRVIEYILSNSPQTEFLLIEASGLSDPDPVREALQTPPVSNKTYLESTVCIIDAVNYESMSQTHSIISTQLADADLVLLSKVNEAGQLQTQRVQTRIQNLAPDVKVLQFTNELTPEIFLASPSVPSSPPHTTTPHEHTHETYQTVLYESNTPLNLDLLQDLIAKLPDEIIRIKGIVSCLDQQGNMLTARVQRVGSHISVDGLRPVTIPLTQILFVGTRLDEQYIKTHLDRCKVLQVAL